MRILIAANGSMYSLSIPLLANDRNCIQRPTSEASTSSHPVQETLYSAAAAAEKSLETELALLHEAKETGVVYLLGHGDIRAGKDSWFFKKLIINYFYAFLRKNYRRGTVNLSIPHSNLSQMSMTYMEGFLCRKVQDTKISCTVSLSASLLTDFGVHSQSLASTTKLTTGFITPFAAVLMISLLGFLSLLTSCKTGM